MVRADWPEMDVIVQGPPHAVAFSTRERRNVLVVLLHPVLDHAEISPVWSSNITMHGVSVVSDDGLISITFPMDELESDFGVLAYMNTRANASGALTQHTSSRRL